MAPRASARPAHASPTTDLVRTGSATPYAAAGCTLRVLPPYSPDLDPIEAAWNKPKALLRGTAARTVEALDAAPSALVGAITAHGARGYCRPCGYAPR